MLKISTTFLCLIMFVGMSISSFAGVVDPTITKSLDQGLDPVGLGKDEASIYKFTINIDGDYDSDGVVKDVLPAEFDAIICSVGTVGSCCDIDTDCDTTSTCTALVCDGGDNIGGACVTDDNCPVLGTCEAGGMASCGSVTIEEKNKPGDKLRPDHVEWDLTGCSGAQSLMICMNTDLNPGRGHQGSYYEPTSCGPLVLNDGASFDEITFSESLVVASCVDEMDTGGCVDGDSDGWSIDCNDCNDADPAINPDATEVCDDNIDNDCDGDIDCVDSDCSCP
jgi:hypothetical protein